MQGHIYHWKHGWIPLTHTAAMVKAKGNRSSAAKYADRYGIENHRTGGERRTGGTGGDAKRVDDTFRKVGHEPRGTFEYKKGTKTRDYPQRPEHAPAAPAGDGPKSAGEAFKMKKAELEPHAKAGNKHAQDELDRRAAKRGDAAPKAAPKAPKAAPTAPEGRKPETLDPRHPDSHLPGAEKRDAETAKALEGKTDDELERLSKTLTEGSAAHKLVKAEQERRTAAAAAAGGHKPLGPSAAERTANAETMYGNGSTQHVRAAEGENREIERSLPAGHTIESRAVKDPVQGGIRGVAHAQYADGERIGAVVRSAGGEGFTAKYKGTAIGKFGSREEGHKALALHHAQAGAAKPELTPESIEAEDEVISRGLPANEKVSGSVSKRFVHNAFGGLDTVQVARSTHYVGDPNSLNPTTGIYGKQATVGFVVGTGDGKYEAEHRYTPIGRKTATGDKLGTFESREAAHKAISDANAAHRAKVAESDARKAKAAASKASKVAGVAGPHGTTWEPHTLPDDGTYSSRMARQKVKQAFKAGDHTVVIETAMSATETKAFLGDVTSATERAAPNLKGKGVSFLVPSGQKWTTKDGTVGAYVHVGGTTVHINPKIADNTISEAFGRGVHTGHFVPAGSQINPREYTLLHELGHVADNVNRHTMGADVSNGMLGASRQRWAEDAPAFHAEHSHSHSEYGKSNAAEGYAEAFVQWSVAGKGSHRTADAYGERFGWAPGGTPARGHNSSTGGQRQSSLQDAVDRAREQREGESMRESSRRVAEATNNKTLQAHEAANGRESAERFAKSVGYTRRADGSYTPSAPQRTAVTSPSMSSAGDQLRQADAARTKPLASTVKAAQQAAAASLSPAEINKLTGGKPFEELTTDQLRAIIRAAIAAKKKG